jgi:phage baseplate assembly protein W
MSALQGGDQQRYEKEVKDTSGLLGRTDDLRSTEMNISSLDQGTRVHNQDYGEKTSST